MVLNALAWLAASYIRLVDRTGRWDISYHPGTAALVRAGKPFIGAFWHGRLLMIYPAWRMLLADLDVTQKGRPHVMTSAHGDGRLIQLATGRFGLGVLWGSSRKGGVKVLREAQRLLKDGNIIVIAPDGPRGPRMRSQPGVAYLASSAKVPVVPITFAAKRQKTLNSWDRFMLVWPFAHGRVAFGEPIQLPDDGDTESHRQLIEAYMNTFSSEIDRAQGLDPVQPAAPVAPAA
jgi:lysophospholipid acyltransferase (LPLAT)-like uncharacterized protein